MKKFVHLNVNVFLVRKDPVAAFGVVTASGSNLLTDNDLCFYVLTMLLFHVDYGRCQSVIYEKNCILVFWKQSLGEYKCVSAEYQSLLVWMKTSDGILMRPGSTECM